jgi:hypothetical protein
MCTLKAPLLNEEDNGTLSGALVATVALTEPHVKPSYVKTFATADCVGNSAVPTSRLVNFKYFLSLSISPPFKIASFSKIEVKAP